MGSRRSEAGVSSDGGVGWGAWYVSWSFVFRPACQIFCAD